MIARTYSRAALALMIVIIASQHNISIFAMIVIWICELVYIVAGGIADREKATNEL